MSRILPDNVHSHGKEVFNEVHTSPEEFFTRLEEKVRAQKIPGVNVSRVRHVEGFTERTYLRVERGTWLFDVGAFPFGEGMFFSWWLSRKPFRMAGAIGVVLWFILIAIVLLSLVSGRLDMQQTLTTFLVSITVLLFIVAMIGSGVDPHVEEKLQEIPFFGGIFSIMASSAPYFQIDTAEIFAASVKGAFDEAVGEVTSGQGIYEGGGSAP